MSDIAGWVLRVMVLWVLVSVFVLLVWVLAVEVAHRWPRR